MRKRKYYTYDAGVDGANKGLEAVNQEIVGHKATIADYKHNASKFGNPEIIDNAEKAIEVAVNEVFAMTQLWGHISKCKNIF